MNQHHSFKSFLIAGLLAGVSLFPLSVQAAGTASVRANVNDEYTRIVFDFDAPPSYLTTQTQNSITLKFQNDVNVSSLNAISSEARIDSAKALDARSLKIEFDNAKEVRHFAIGNRVIVDVYGDKTQNENPKADKPKSEQSIVEPDKTKDIQAEKTDVKAKDITVDEPVATTETKDIIKQDEVNNDKNVKGAALLSLTAPKQFKLAVYQKNNELNIVVDQADVQLNPQLSGDADLVKALGDVKRHSVSTATLFTYALPTGIKVKVEGGGLLWRIIVADSVSDTPKATLPTRADGALSWAVSKAGQTIKFIDPVSQDQMVVVPSDSGKFLTGDAQNFVDARLLPAFAGMAVIPKRDDVELKTTADAVILTRAQGLNFSALPITKTELTPNDTPQADDQKTEETTTDGAINSEPKADEAVTDTTRYFDFAKWQMGGIKKIKENREQAMKAFAAKTRAEQADHLLLLAKMELSNGMAAEAKGYLDYAIALVPELAETTTVKSMLGATHALLGHDDIAFQDFADERFKKNAEIQMWRAVTLANLEDWAQAGDNVPDYPILLETYPASLQLPLALSLAEIALRQGDVKNADKILELVAKQDKHLNTSQKAAHDYLRGESDRQKGKLEDAKKFWQPLTTGADDLYRVKAGLSLTNLELETKKITIDEAIDRLEGFRYTWRGDELEIAALFRLGRLYIDKGEPVKGLTMLRQAASLDPQSEQSGVITALMQKTYKDLFLTEQLDALNPIDAVTVHTEFAELSPSDEEGDQIIERLADRLASVDLLPRAASLLQAQIDTRLTGARGAEAAIKLAGIYTQDQKPEKALEVLNKADEFLKPLSVDASAPFKKQIGIARAEAYGQAGKVDEALNALSLLAQDALSLRLRADIAWENERWQDAADAMEELAAQLDISPSRPVDDEQGELLLNWALALHKANNDFVLNDLRERFGAAMAASPLKEKFDMITRPKQNSVLVDRASIDQMMAEVDLFKKAGDVGAVTPQAVDAAASANAPAESKVTEAKTTESKPAPPSQGEADVAGADGEAGKTGATDAGSSAVP